jgi:hypothetical protein
MRQRRTGDPTVTRKPGPNGTALRQENAALRQKITVLEQELARQQRAMAKPAQQEGLGMKALREAVNKPNGGYVFYDDETREFNDGLSPRPDPLSIPPWVPKKARPEIEMMWDKTLPDKDVRAALKRLVTDGKMRGVWKELCNVKYVADIAEIIPWAIEAIEMFALLSRYQQHLDILWRKHAHPTGGYDWKTCARYASGLRYALEQLRTVLDPIGDELWSDYWRGDPAMSSMGAGIKLLALENCLQAIDNEMRSVVKRFSSIARPGNLRAPQRFFAQYMIDKMVWVCSRPRYDILAALICVAFNVDVNANTVREWCRDRSINS